MNLNSWWTRDPNAIRPSWMHNGTLALGCFILAVALFRGDTAKIEGALFMAIFLLLSAGVLLSTHLPGSTGIWLDKDGFLVRDMYKSERYLWSEVGQFAVRRRMLGSGVEFPHVPSGDTMPKMRSLPRGLGRSGWRLVRLMNERRDEALAGAK